MNKKLLTHRRVKSIKPARQSVRPDSDDTLFRLLPAALTILGLAVGIWQFTSQQAYNDKMEFKRRIWEKRMAAYSDIGDVVAKIASDKDGSDFDSLYQKFNEMYWGKIPLFEDTSVEKAMIDFQNQLKDKDEEVVDIFQKNEYEKIGLFGHRLVKTCQQSMSKSWTELSK